VDNREGVGECSFESLYYDHRMYVAFKLREGLRQNLTGCGKSGSVF
jgi:hypothetical protein